ncbi:hypothetical protein HBDW_34320 [Herbaspirillum sp. DW155]|nr:hypothetical protein HBDW_34320 [Herbaspirillum sp. DW155]
MSYLFHGRRNRMDGVMLGGDALGREQAPLEVAAFLQSVFGPGK